MNCYGLVSGLDLYGSVHFSLRIQKLEFSFKFEKFEGKTSLKCSFFLCAIAVAIAVAVTESCLAE